MQPSRFSGHLSDRVMSKDEMAKKICRFFLKKKIYQNNSSRRRNHLLCLWIANIFLRKDFEEYKIVDAILLTAKKLAFQKGFWIPAIKQTKSNFFGSFSTVKKGTNSELKAREIGGTQFCILLKKSSLVELLSNSSFWGCSSETFFRAVFR